MSYMNVLSVMCCTLSILELVYLLVRELIAVSNRRRSERYDATALESAW